MKRFIAGAVLVLGFGLGGMVKAENPANVQLSCETPERTALRKALALKISEVTQRYVRNILESDFLNEGLDELIVEYKLESDFSAGITKIEQDVEVEDDASVWFRELLMVAALCTKKENPTK